MASFYAAVLNVPAPLVRYDEQACDKGAACRYYSEVRNKKIYPKELYFDLTATHDIRQFFFSMAHEMRHHYQAVVISDQGRNLESLEQIKKWEEEILFYKDKSQSGYDDQEVELDANAFGILMMELLFEENTPVNLERINIDLLQKAIERIADVYDTDRTYDLAEKYNIPVELGLR